MSRNGGGAQTWHPFGSAKICEIAFRALLTGGASEMELVVVKQISARACSQNCVQGATCEVRRALVELVLLILETCYTTAVASISIRMSGW
jgi:hypothetical protein